MRFTPKLQTNKQTKHTTIQLPSFLLKLQEHLPVHRHASSCNESKIIIKKNPSIYHESTTKWSTHYLTCSRKCFSLAAALVNSIFALSSSIVFCCNC